MMYCEPPLQDIRKCDHPKLKFDPPEEDGVPLCQCKKGDSGWWVRSGPIWRMNEYGLQTQTGISHSPRWERKGINRRFTLRIDRDVLRKIKSKPGPKGRLSPRLPINKRNVGGPARGSAHVMRRASLLTLHESPQNLATMLELAKHHTPSKKKDVTVHMPNLELAVNTLVNEIEEEREKRYRREQINLGTSLTDLIKLKLPPHHLLLRDWAPTLCRLIEIRELFGKSRVIHERDEEESSLPPEEDLYHIIEEGVWARSLDED